MKKLFSILILSICLIQLPVFATSEDSVENNYLKIDRTEKQLKSRLGNIYNGYEFTIQNLAQENITIKRTEFWYNANGTVAFLSVKKDNKTAASQTFEKGKKYASRTLGLSLILYGIAAPFSAIKNDIGNANAENEAKSFDLITLNNKTIEPNEKITIKTMAMKRHRPVFKLIFINPITDEYMNMILK